MSRHVSIEQCLTTQNYFKNYENSYLQPSEKRAKKQNVRCATKEIRSKSKCLNSLLAISFLSTGFRQTL